MKKKSEFKFSVDMEVHHNITKHEAENLLFDIIFLSKSIKRVSLAYGGFLTSAFLWWVSGFVTGGVLLYIFMKAFE